MMLLHCRRHTWKLKVIMLCRKVIMSLDALHSWNTDYIIETQNCIDITLNIQHKYKSKCLTSESEG